MFFRSLAAIRKRRKQTEANGNRPHNRRQSVTLDNIRKRQTPNHDTNGRPPEVYNHSGIIGNAIPGSENQQKPSDHDKSETSNPNRHNFQTISKICTASFQIMPEVKKRYIIRAYTQGSGSARNQQERPDDHGKRPDRNSFQKSATILIFCGRGFANRHFAETDSLYVPCPDCPVLFPYFCLRKPSKAVCNLLQLTAGYRQVSNRKCHFLPSKCQVNAKLKTQKPTFYLRKLWKNHGFTTLNCVFATFSNLSNLRNLISYYGIFRTTYGKGSQPHQLGDSWGAVGRKLGNRICGHLGQLVYMHVKILKPEVKRPDAKLHAQKFRNQRYYYGNAYMQKF